MNLDKDGQPLETSFNKNRNAEKAVLGLRGILTGVVADQKLNDQELLFLDVWLKSQEALNSDGDVIDLLDLINDILEDGVITSDELNQLQDLINDIIAYRKFEFVGEEGRINELLGLIAGIAADQQIVDAEINSLKNWLSDNSDIKDAWPVNVISNRLDEILEDGIVTDEERSDLLETLKQITGSRFEETGLAYGMSTEFCEDEVETINHEGSCFCFTGKFVSGSRSVVEKSAISKGAETKRDVSKAVNYLVIGILASRDWRFSSHGRKIEKAVKLRGQGVPIRVISERVWLKCGG